MRGKGPEETWSRCRWQGLQVRHPSSWEILRFRKDFRSGFLIWADRHGYRFQISWQRESSARDEERVVSDFIGKSHMKDPGKEVLQVKGRPWPGVASRQAERKEERFFKVIPDGRCLLEAVVVDAAAVDPVVVDAVLESVQVADKRHSTGEWEAFGLKFEVPSRFRLQLGEVLPASVTLQFDEPGEQPAEITFSRMGMLRYWMKNDMESWWNDKWRDRTAGEVLSHRLESNGIPVYTERRYLRPEGAFNKLRPLRKLFTCLWVDPADGRLYRHSYQCVGRNRNVDFAMTGSLSVGGKSWSGTILKEVFGDQ